MAADFAMGYDSVKQLAKEIGDIHHDFAGMIQTLGNLVDSLDGQWVGTAHDEFIAAYKELRPKLNTISSVMGNYETAIRKGSDRQFEVDNDLSKRYRGINGNHDSKSTNNVQDSSVSPQKNNPKYEGSVIVNDNPSYPNNKAQRIVPTKSNIEGRRNQRAYNEVLDSFDVEHRSRYQQDANGNTWCNVYVSDVTYAMGCEIPHYYDPQTGDPLPTGARGGRYTSAAGIRDWLSTYGEQHGWIECDAETAQSMANQGYPSMALDTSGAHVAMVAPQREGETGVQISQAGWKNFNHTSVGWGWSKGYQLKYYYHL